MDFLKGFGTALLGTTRTVRKALRNLAYASWPSIISGLAFIFPSLHKTRKGHSMPTVHFIGRVFPLMDLTMDGLKQIEWVDDPTNLRVAVTVHIKNAEVDVECSLNREFEPADFHSLHLNAFKWARTFIDLVALHTGTGQTLIFESFIASDGTRTPIHPNDTTLNGLCAVPIHIIVEMTSREPLISLAINTLTSTLDRPDVIPQNCALAMDVLSQLISPGEKDERKRWIALRGALNITEGYLRFITNLSKGPRHGDWASRIPGADQRESRVRAWTIMDRFLNFRLRGNVTLTSPNFPLL